MTEAYDLSTQAAAVDTAIRLIEANDPSDVARQIIRAVANYDGSLNDCSDTYVHARLYMLAGKFARARCLLGNAPEQTYAAFDLSVIDFLAEGKPFDLRHFARSIHSELALQICMNALAAAGRTKEAMTFLNAIAGNRSPLTPAKSRVKPFFLATMPKSGTGFLVSALRKLTGATLTPATISVGPHEALVGSWIDAALEAHALPTGHWAPFDANREQLLHFALPVFLTVRDPRDATWSWFRYMEERPRLWKMALAYLPTDYCDRPYAERIAIMFRQYYPCVMQWLVSWKTFLETHLDYPVRVMSYPDFSRDNAAAVQALLNFCGASISVDEIGDIVAQMKSEGGATGKYHFRVGRAAGWRDVMTRDIQASIDAHWDEDVVRYFDLVA